MPIVYKLRWPDTHGKRWCVIDDLKTLQDEMDMAEVGDRCEIEKCEMTQSELDELPEFEGW